MVTKVGKNVDCMCVGALIFSTDLSCRDTDTLELKSSGSNVCLKNGILFRKIIFFVYLYVNYFFSTIHPADFWNNEAFPVTLARLGQLFFREKICPSHLFFWTFGARLPPLFCPKCLGMLCNSKLLIFSLTNLNV